MFLKSIIKNSINSFISIIPLEWKRLANYYIYTIKKSSKIKNSESEFKKIYETNTWKSEESRSGEGSTINSTKTIRKELPLLIHKYRIKSMLDVPCGDFNWMKTVPLNCSYIGGDIVPEIVENNQNLYSSDKIQFKKIDITLDTLTKVDLIFCKDCLQHLSYENVHKTLHNFKNSCSKFLLVTSYPKTQHNHDIYDGDYRALNLLIEPFCLPKPILAIREKSKAPGVEADKTMYLYDLEKLTL